MKIKKINLLTEGIRIGSIEATMAKKINEIIEAGEKDIISWPCSTPKPDQDCSGCTDPRSEGTHQGCTKQHGHVGCAEATQEPRTEPRKEEKYNHCDCNENSTIHESGCQKNIPSQPEEKNDEPNDGWKDHRWNVQGTPPPNPAKGEQEEWDSITWLQKEFGTTYLKGCHLKSFIKSLLETERAKAQAECEERVKDLQYETNEQSEKKGEV